jgi:hypothetical protein
MRTQLICLLLTCCLSITTFAQTGQWDSVDNSLNDAISTLYVDSNYLYAGGWFTQAGGKQANYIARWNGKEWDSIGTGFNYIVHAISSYKDTLYAGGGFNKTGDGRTMPFISRWNGQKWDSLGSGITGWAPTVRALKVYKNELYVGGELGGTDSVTSPGVIRWNGGSWKTVGGGVWGYVTSFTTYKDTLFVGGQFDSAGGIFTKNIAKWDGNKWHRVGSIKSMVRELNVYQNKLYATVAGTIFKWEGTQWSPAHTIKGKPIEQLQMMYTFEDKMFVGGYFDSINTTPAQNVAYLQDTMWYGINDTINNGVLTATTYKDTLYIGGGFDSIGNQKIKYIAKWHPLDNSIDNVGLTSDVKTTLYPNPFSHTAMLNIRMEEVAWLSEQQLSFIFYDVSGRRVKLNYQVIGKSSHKLSIKIINNGLPESGVYFYEVANNQKKIAAGKFVIY